MRIRQLITFFGLGQPSPSVGYVVESLFWSCATHGEVDPEGEASDADAAAMLADLDAARLAQAWSEARRESVWSTREEAEAEALAILRRAMEADIAESPSVAECLSIDESALRLTYRVTGVADALWWLRTRVTEVSAPWIAAE